MSHKSKQKISSESEISFPTLCGFLIEQGISEEDAIARITLQDLDPAKDFYLTVVTAWREVQKEIRSGSTKITNNDKYDALFSLMEKGEKIMKTLTSIKGSAYPTEEPKNDNRPIGDR
jgi:hypothetical protein